MWKTIELTKSEEYIVLKYQLSHYLKLAIFGNMYRLILSPASALLM